MAIVEARPNSFKAISDSFKAYEDGKHRRYSLLFAVNGGAFAVAKIFSAKILPAKILSDQNAMVLLGQLTLPKLSFGMVLFTVVMVFDIFVFGEKMRCKYLRGAFGWEGKAVLLSIGLIICAGWLLVVF